MLIRQDLHFGGGIQEFDNIDLHLRVTQFSEDQKRCLLLSNTERFCLPTSPQLRNVVSLCKQLNVVVLTFQYMAPKIKPIRRDSNDVSAMLIPCRLELLMKPSASSVITDVLVSEDRFIAENYLQGNTISKNTFMHHLHNSNLNSRTDTSKCCVHEVHFIQNLTGNFWPQVRSSHFCGGNCVE